MKQTSLRVLGGEHPERGEPRADVLETRLVERGKRAAASSGEVTWVS